MVVVSKHGPGKQPTSGYPLPFSLTTQFTSQSFYWTIVTNTFSTSTASTSTSTSLFLTRFFSICGTFCCMFVGNCFSRAFFCSFFQTRISFPFFVHVLPLTATNPLQSYPHTLASSLHTFQTTLCSTALLFRYLSFVL